MAHLLREGFDTANSTQVTRTLAHFVSDAGRALRNGKHFVTPSGNRIRIAPVDRIQIAAGPTHVHIDQTTLPGVFLVAGAPFSDHRGAFARLFCEHELAPVLGSRRIVQVNHSRTAVPGAVRGMHYQLPPHAEMKLVRCLKGRVWDVAVDLRSESPTFLRWHAEELTTENARMLVIPEGFAHGFQVLEAQSELLYLHTAFYNPAAEGGVSCNDPRLAIGWPLPVTDLSERDKGHAPIEPGYIGIAL